MRSPSPGARSPSESHTSLPINDEKYTFHSSSNMYYTRTNRLQLALNKIKKKIYRIPMRMKLLTFFTLILLSFAMIKGLMIFTSGVSSWMNTIPPLIIEKQDYSPVKYVEIDPNASTELPEGVSIYHVTKEFGEASLRGLGQMVTGLSRAQSTNTSIIVNVVMPYYSFLSKLYRPHKFAQFVIKVRDRNGVWKDVKFLVYRLFWNIMNNEDVLANNSKENPSHIISVFMIGPASNVVPLNQAFKAPNRAKIYSTKSDLPLEWMDLYFCKAAAEFITYRNIMIDTPLFAKSDTRGVDIVHIHGSSNALTIEFLKKFHKSGKLGKKIPAIIYTIHDYLEEQLYSNDIINIQKFIEFDKFQQDKPQYFYNNRMYMSGYAIDNSQIVTFVSKTLAKEMIEGPMEFPFRELIMPNILNKAKLGQWFGITSGIDFTAYNPFNDTMLVESNANFPKNINNFDPVLLYAESIEGASQELVATSKQSAKAYLIREGLLNKEDLIRPLILYIGRFEYSKGLQFFNVAVELFVKMDAKFIIMGQKNNYPSEKLKRLSANSPDNIIYIDDLEFQKDWDVIYRAASDILFIPSLTESSGSVAAEGLLFGMPIISTGVGGLKEFLVDKTENDNKADYNSYLFELVDDLIISLSFDNMKLAIIEAINDWKRMNADIREKEIFLRKLIKDAFKLSWNRPEGPVEHYLKIYKMAMLQIHDKLEEELWLDYDNNDYIFDD
ncbi:UDP-Glycosyltransferase/glycogen phosphorylase [Rhizophagus irregularis]|uniref:starch synthase n=1 Tax=Rhizophagus irregularis TaxID=588596 RepID=A0A2N0SC84_9GLOM|nr:UDP-Glycosyltransferase/glycogen phosphorylase [Rhizophagus irregularis]